MMLFAMGCDGGNNNGGNGNINDDGDIVNQGGNGSVEEKNAEGEFFFKGKVTSLEDRNHIEMEIIDSQVAFGIYWVIIDSSTVYVNAEGVTITKDDIKAGDTIEVIFSGQVMMSLPPRIYAQKIILK